MRFGNDADLSHISSRPNRNDPTRPTELQPLLDGEEVAVLLQMHATTLQKMAGLARSRQKTPTA
jgi:hypothetical protein